MLCLSFLFYQFFLSPPPLFIGLSAGQALQVLHSVKTAPMLLKAECFNKVT